uniref:Reverse transcriptase domain-containing protein n=1 Tax=Cannabis sativa TaxID=3483 RepID=A0A803PCZ5_CANSA
MHSDKVPGPDGMNSDFFQKHWDIVGVDITSLVIEFFVTGTLPPDLNLTNLVLIPKKKNFMVMSDLRSFALCNVIYKVVSKVLTNRMRNIIDQIISTTRSAFIPGRLIYDNVMVPFEVMHYLKRKTKGRKGYMAIKLDMSKAYDRVEWDYLWEVMIHMGFHIHWIDLVMHCVSTARYNVIHDGHYIGPINPTRGIRQGNPLSTYLFIICAEGLSSLIQQYETNWIILGCHIAHGAPLITHMLFANDSYLFFQATNEAAEADEGSLYLGLPNIIGRNKSAIFGFLKNKSLPTYAMSVFLISIDICEDIEKLMASFWWKTSSSKGNSIIWMSWNRMVTSKDDGDTLVGQIFKAKYFPHSDFLSAELGNNPSFVWRSIWGAQNLVKRGAIHTIGNGASTSILSHPWLPSSDNRFVSSTHPCLISNNVSSLFSMDSRTWDVDIVRDLFPPREANMILGLPLSHHASDDFWSWSNDSKSWLDKMFCLLEEDQFSHRPRPLLIIGEKFKITLVCLLCSLQTMETALSFGLKPENNHIKINVDAALFLQENSYGFGIVARDSSGHLIEAKTGYYEGNLDASTVEALSIKEALSWIKSMNWQNVEIESDNMISVQGIRGNQSISSLFSLLLCSFCNLLILAWDQEPARNPPADKAPKKSSVKAADKKVKAVESKEEPLDPVAEKLRQQRLVEEADYKSTKELFAKKGEDKTLDNFIPKSESDFQEYAELISHKLLPFEKSFHYINLLKAVMRLATTSLKAADAKDVASSITAIANEKLKLEKEANAGKKKTGAKKKQLLVDKPDDDLVATRYDDMDDYDFIRGSRQLFLRVSLLVLLFMLFVLHCG